MNLRSFVILIGAVSAWLCGAWAGGHALSGGAEVVRTPGGPQPVWIGIGESGIVASEQRESGGGDDGPAAAVWVADGFECDSRCSGLVCGPVCEVRSSRGGAVGARSPPV